MSFATRAPIAAALSTVAGVTGYSYAPRAPKTGDAWLNWLGDEHVPEAGVFVTSWRITILLPDDNATQEAWIEARRDALWEALQPYAFVDSFEPGTFAETPALMINVRSD